MITDTMTARLRPAQAGRTTLVSVLDIGSTKICCVIARLTPRAIRSSRDIPGLPDDAQVDGWNEERGAWEYTSESTGETFYVYEEESEE